MKIRSGLLVVMWWCATLALMGAVTAAVSGQERGFQQVDPAEVGLSPQRLNELAEAAEAYVENNTAIGSELLVIKDRRLVLHRVFGAADQEDERAWTDDVICNIRSMTKPITGVAAQILIDRGKLDLDAPVAEYLTEGFDNDKSRAITVRQVLTHRSGLPLTILQAVDEYPDLLTQVNASGQRGPEFEPGSKFWYSDAGTDVVAALVEHVSGKPLAEFVQQEILDPLGMSDTFYGVDGEDPRFQRIASLYVGTPNAWVRFWNPQQGPFYPFAWGSQTLYSTPEDYAKFLAMLMDGGKVGDARILSEEAVGRILDPVSAMSMLGSDAEFPTEFRGLKAYYGQMSVIYCDPDDPDRGVQIFGHSGSDGTGAWAIPGQDLMVLYFTQSRGGASVIRLERAIDRFLVKPEAYLADEQVPEKYRPYLGTFVANFAAFDNEEFTVMMRDGKLALDIPSQMVFALNDPDEDGLWSFVVAPDQIQVTFGEDEDGDVQLLRIHQSGQVFDVPRQGTPLAAEMQKEREAELADRIEVSVAEMEALVGTYRNDDRDVNVEVVIEEGELCAKFPPGITVHLHTTKEQDHWGIKEDPSVTMEFQRNEEGQATSIVQRFGGNSIVFERQ